MTDEPVAVGGEEARPQAGGGFLTLQERLFLAEPIELAPDELACDRYGCNASARYLIPCAALCGECAAGFGVGDVDLVQVDYDELVGGEEWRLARARDYIARIQAEGPHRRDVWDDELIGRLAQRSLADDL